MLGLMFIVGIGSVLLLVALAMWAAKRISLKAGQSAATAQRWKYGVLAAVLLAIFWDWLPTWIAYEYYSRQAGLTVFKTLEQWKAENPGVAQTLEAYGKTPQDQRDDTIRLGQHKTRTMLNARFAFDREEARLLLSVRSVTLDLVDASSSNLMARHVKVRSGNSGGIASGGEGWLKPWLIHGSEDLGTGSEEFFDLVERAKTLGDNS